MPHLILSGELAWERAEKGLGSSVHRFGRAVLKIETCWRRADRRALLVEGVVVEHSRPLHPVAVVAERGDGISIRLWPHSVVERTPAVQRWLAVVAAELQRLGAGPVSATNIAAELLADLPLARA